MEDGIACPDVGEEGVSKPLALMGSLHKTRNVNNIQKRWDFTEKWQITKHYYLIFPANIT